LKLKTNEFWRRTGLFLGYTTFEEKQIKQGVKKLAQVFQEQS
jgi:hypothetical protein